MSALKNIAYFLTGLILSKPLGFALSIVVAKALGPDQFGVWVTLMLVISYSPIVCLGTVETMLKQVPYFRGRGEVNLTREVEANVFGSVILSSSILVLATIASFVVVPRIWPTVDPLLAAMMLLAAASSFVSAYFYNRFAAYEDFKASGSMDLARSALALLFVGGLAWRHGLVGAVTGYLLHELIVCALLARTNVKAHGTVGANFKLAAFAKSVQIGFPITLLWWVLTLTGTIDRLVLGKLLGPLSVGHYGLGLSLAAILGLVPLVVGRVLYPKVNKHIGQKSDSETMEQLVVMPTRLLGTLLLNLQIVILTIMPFLYNQVLPKYQPGLLAGEILIVGSYFGSLMRNGANYLIAINEERVFLWYIIATLIFNLVVDTALVKAGLGISGVAIGTSFAGIFLNTVVWRKVLFSLNFRARKVWITLLEFYLPIIALTSALAFIHFLAPQAFFIFSSTTLMYGIGLLVALNALIFWVPTSREHRHALSIALSRLRPFLARRYKI